MIDAISLLFPGLRVSTFQVTSPSTRDYNCIAWAAGKPSQWWWPTGDPDDDLPIWPEAAPREVTIPAFIAAFATLGYVPCDNDTYETGWEKVAIFTDERQRPTHAARQLGNGRWTSKLGESEDIEHELRAIEGDIYGAVTVLMKKNIDCLIR